MIEKLCSEYDRYAMERLEREKKAIEVENKRRSLDQSIFILIGYFVH